MDSAKAILVFSIVFLIVPLVILIVRGQILAARERMTPEQAEAAMRVRQRKLLSSVTATDIPQLLR